MVTMTVAFANGLPPLVLYWCAGYWRASCGKPHRQSNPVLDDLFGIGHHQLGLVRLAERHDELRLALG
jgi:hypothetical protein